jgi:hypothetical protein
VVSLRLTTWGAALFWSLLLAAVVGCDDENLLPPETVPLLPLAVGNSWEFTHGYADTVYTATVISGVTWYQLRSLVFPALRARFLLRADTHDRYWIRFNNTEAIALDPEWPIQEWHSIDLGLGRDHLSVRIHSKHLRYSVLGDTLSDCFVIEFREEGVIGGNWQAVMARGIGTVRVWEGHIGPQDLISYTLVTEEDK